METFAYLHAAQEYEYPEEKEISLNWFNPTALTLLGIACSTWAVNFTSAAQAATIFRGDTGANVTHLQDLLRNAGYFPADTTGFFGDFTEAAVQDFQHSKGLAADGVAGYQTFEALEKSVAPGNSTAPVNVSGTSIASGNSINSPSINFDAINLDVTLPPIGSVDNNLPAPGSVDNTALGFGDGGSEVTRLQDLLRRAGYFPGPSTGYFGAPTRQSLERFQQANGLPVDGFAGQATFAALENAPAAGTI